MHKRAQVSMFIMLGIVILAALAIYFSMRSEQMNIDTGQLERIGTEVPRKAEPVKQFIEQCIQNAGDPAIRLLGMQGGRLDLSDPATFSQFTAGNVSFAMDRGSITLLDRNAMAKELATYLTPKIATCIGDLGPLRSQWQQLFAEGMQLNATIRDNQVLLRLHYPLTLVDKEGTTRIADFGVIVPIRLGYTHSMLTNITRELSRYPDWIDVTLLSKRSTPDISIAVIPEIGDRYLLTLTDNSSLPPFVFLAGVQVRPNIPPKLAVQRYYELPEGQEFTLQVTATDDVGVQFSDDTALFDIDPSSGLIKFTPQVPGTEQVRITATDARGAFDSEQVTFNITEVR